MKITGIYKMLDNIRVDFGGGNDIYQIYKAVKLEYLKHENEHPDFCGFIEMYYYNEIMPW